MEGLQVQWADIIKAASQNPLGIVALVVLGLMVVAVIFFRGASVAVRGLVFAGLVAGGGTLVGVMLHERGDLQQTVDHAKALDTAAAAVASGDPASSSGSEAFQSAHRTELLSDTRFLTDIVASTPGLQGGEQVAAAQQKLGPHRAKMLPRKDPQTGELQPPAEPLDSDTQAAARVLAQSVRESLKGKSALELRELLREKPVE